MRFTATTSADGVTARSFTLGELPGVLWTPDGAGGTRPLILIGHGGGQHKRAPAVLANAVHLVAAGFAVVAIDAPNHGDRPKDAEFVRITDGNRARMMAGEDVGTEWAALHTMLAERSVPEWRAVVTAVQELDNVGPGPVGYWGMSMGCGLGVPFVAAEPRVRAAVLGLAGSLGLAAAAAQVTAPVLFLMQWDDRLVPRAEALALFDAFASPVKSLHANPGNHGDVPRFEMDGGQAFFARHLV